MYKHSGVDENFHLKKLFLEENDVLHKIIDAFIAITIKLAIKRDKTQHNSVIQFVLNVYHSGCMRFDLTLAS
jgi:hypothetical protein